MSHRKERKGNFYQQWSILSLLVGLGLVHLVFFTCWLGRLRKCLADQGVKWPECGGSWGVDGCKKVASSGWLLGGAGPWPWDLERGQRPRCGARRPPCGNLPVFNVGERTAGGQVLPNGNRALQPPVKKFSTWTCNKFSDKFFMLDMTFWAEALSSYLMKNLLNKAFCIQKKKSRWLAFVFIGPESDHCLP